MTSNNVNDMIHDTKEPPVSTMGYYIHTTTDGTVPSLLSRDYKDPMIVCVGVDGYNQSCTGDVAKSLTAIQVDVEEPDIRLGIFMSKQPIVLESNQNHSTIISDGICNTLPASMGLGGGYVPMIVLQRRFSDVNVSYSELSPCLEAGTGQGGNNLPMIVLLKGNSSQEGYTDGDISTTLKAVSYKDPPLIVMKDEDDDSRS